MLRTCVRTYVRTYVRAYVQEAFYTAAIQKLKLGKNSRPSNRPQGSRDKIYLRQSTSQGARQAGGGREDAFKPEKFKVKQWLEEERSYGHSIGKSDLWFEYKWQLEESMEIERRKVLEDPGNAKAKARHLALKTRLEKITASTVYLNTTKKELLKFCGARLLKPQRFVNLTLEEEKARAHVTWMSYDKLMDLAAFGTPEELSEVIANGEEWVENRENTVLGWSDQIPVWVKGDMDQARVFLSSEARSKHEPGVLAASRMSQKRACYGEGSDKFRVTLELRNVIYNWFSRDEDKQPVGAIPPALLVVYGSHGRLSNISSNHTFIKDEVFYIGSKRIERKAGSSTKGLMKSWVELREKHPELFSNITLMQQPAAWLDDVIHAWSLEELSQQFPQALWQRDVLATHCSQGTQDALMWSHQLQSIIAGKMTPVLQLCDTDFGFPLKASMRRAHEWLQSKLKLKSKLLGVTEQLQYGNLEVLECVHAALEDLKKTEATRTTPNVK